MIYSSNYNKLRTIFNKIKREEKRREDRIVE